VPARTEPSPASGIVGIDTARALVERTTAESQRTTQALQRSEATWRAMVDGLTDAVAFADLQRRILHVNPAFTAMWGYPADEVLGRGTEILYADPADHAALGQARFSAGTSAEDHLYQLRYRRRDGSEFWGETIGIRVTDASGTLFGYLGVHRDITERLRAEEALRRSRAQLAAFVQQAPHSLALFDRNMDYLAASRQWVRLYGHGHADLVGLNHYELTPNLPQTWKDAHRRALAGETIRNDSDQWKDDDGGEHWLSWVVQPWTDELGEVAGIIISSDASPIRRVPIARSARPAIAWRRSSSPPRSRW
jgi:two-component system, sensor histidine kinase and response regulator